MRYSQRPMVPLTLFLLVAIAASGCRAVDESSAIGSRLLVDFGPVGNDQARRNIDLFGKSLDDEFVSRQSGRRAVLLTGFNPFGGEGSSASSSNISGELISHMEQRDRAAGSVVLEREGGGARIARTTSKINGEEVDVYYFRGNTTYVTPALIQVATQKIGPNRVINFGQGPQNMIETGASNSTFVGAKSYDENGRVIPILTNQSSRVDESKPAEGTTPLSWNPSRITGPTGFPAAPGARPENDYICNATAKVLAETMQGREVKYLDGVTLSPIKKPENGDMKHTFIHIAPNQDLNKLDSVTRDVLAESFKDAPPTTVTPATPSSPSTGSTPSSSTPGTTGTSTPAPGGSSSVPR